jgi:hypothetical protein
VNPTVPHPVLALLDPLLAAHRHFADMGLGDWAIVVVAVLASLASVWLMVRYAVYPGETEPDHIKRSILADDPATVITVAGRPVSGPPPVPRAP